MKIAVLSDNRAEGGSLEPEHGLSLYLETAQFSCLLDVLKR
jgi:metal-dependent hydrolase (beta-lactamase superfamily II)